MIKFRDLKASEIECRAAMVRPKGVQLLLYKDARCDMRILDEIVGTENWQKEFYEHKGTLFCRVGIFCKVGARVNPTDNVCEWVWKADAGEPSNMSAQKGEASDAFKRACTNWGIGRELYTSPFIWVPAGKCDISQSGQKATCRDHFSVAKIQIEDGEITGLRIQNDTKGCVAFSWRRQ